MYVGLDRATYIFKFIMKGHVKKMYQGLLLVCSSIYLSSKIVWSKCILYRESACSLLWKSNGAICTGKSDVVLPSVSKPMQSSNMRENLHENVWFSSPLAVRVKW